MKMWVFNCKEVSRLVSESMDGQLSWNQRLGIRFHLMMCRYCARFSKQLEQMRTFIQQSLDREVSSKMDEDVKKKIKERLSSYK